MTTCYIYALVDPQTDEIFYVGSSIWLEYRFNSYIHGRTNKANQERIEQITANGYEFKMRILEKVPEEMRLEREKEWIDRLREEGASLTNIRLIDKEKTQQRQIIAIIPDELHYAFKIATIRQGQTMTEVIVTLLTKWVEEGQSDQGSHPKTEA